MCFQGYGGKKNQESIMLALVPRIYQNHLILLQIFTSSLQTGGHSEVVAASGKLTVASLPWITFLLLSFLPTPFAHLSAMHFVTETLKMCYEACEEERRKANVQLVP